MQPETDTLAIKAPHPLKRLEELRRIARALMEACDQPHLRGKVAVDWNTRLRSTAGRTRYTLFLVELNPRLLAFPGEDERTLRHELAHVLAWERSKKRGRKIAPHGPEWVLACADLGIPGESATHSLPLPTRRFAKPYKYACPSCKEILERARALRRPSACLACCRKYNHGKFDRKFLFQRTA